MKYIKTLFLSTIFFYAFLVNAQNRVYVMKGGESVVDYEINTEIDSIIFYDPVVNPPLSSDVPFYSETLTKGVGTTSNWNKAYSMFNPNRETDGSPIKYHYTSQANGGETVGIFVLLPPSYDTQTDKRYPVLYHLHGRGETETQQEDSYMGVAKNGMASGALTEFIYISVGGPVFCWWSDEVVGTVKAESHIINEILSLVDQNFRTLPKRESRGISGFSMGGYGATKIAFKYPQYFSASGAFCGATYSYPGGDDTQLMTGNWGFSDDYNTIWNGDVERYKLDNARYYVNTNAAELISNNMTILVRPGSSDGYKIFSDGLKADLDANNVPHQFTLYNGGHSLGSINLESLQYLLSNMDTQ